MWLLCRSKESNRETILFWTQKHGSIKLLLKKTQKHGSIKPFRCERTSYGLSFQAHILSWTQEQRTHCHNLKISNAMIPAGLPKRKQLGFVHERRTRIKVRIENKQHVPSLTLHLLATKIHSSIKNLNASLYRFITMCWTMRKCLPEEIELGTNPTRIDGKISDGHWNCRTANQLFHRTWLWPWPSTIVLAVK